MDQAVEPHRGCSVGEPVLDLGSVRVRAAVEEVLAQRAGDQHRVAAGIGEPSRPLGRVCRLEVDAAIGQLAARRLELAGGERREDAGPRRRVADHRHMSRKRKRDIEAGDPGAAAGIIGRRLAGNERAGAGQRRRAAVLAAGLETAEHPGDLLEQRTRARQVLPPAHDGRKRQRADDACDRGRRHLAGRHPAGQRQPGAETDGRRRHQDGDEEAGACGDRKMAVAGAHRRRTMAQILLDPGPLLRRGPVGADRRQAADEVVERAPQGGALAPARRRGAFLRLELRGPDERRDREQHREGKREPPVVPERVEEGKRDAAAGHHRRDHGGADPAGVARQTLTRERCRLPGLLAGARAGVQDAPEHVPAQACRDPPLDRRLGPAQCQRQQRTQDGEPGERRRRREDERGPLEADAAEQHQRLIGDPVRKVDLQAQEGCERRALEGGSGNADVERDAQEIESDPGEPEGEDEKCEGGKMKRRGRAPDEAEGIALHG